MQRIATERTRLRGRPRQLTLAVTGLRLTSVWAIAAVAVPTAIAASIPLSSIDLTYHLRAGRIMLDLHHVMRTDVFTSTAGGAAWVNQQWGAQVLLAGMFGFGGWLALAAFRVSVTAFALTTVYASCRHVGATRRWATGLTLAFGIPLAGGFLVRPQVFGVACFAATQWLLSRRHRHPASVAWCLPVVVIWANTHGSFFLAPVLFALAWAEDRQRTDPHAWRILAGGLVTIPLTLLNPFGVRAWGYVTSIAADERIRSQVTEWRPPTLETAAGVLFLVSAVGVAVYVGTRWSSVRWPTLAGLGLFLVLGLLSIRGSLWWFLAAPVLIAGIRPAEASERERPDPRGWVNVVLASVFCLVALAPLVRWLPYRGRDAPNGLLTDAPAGITRALDEVLRPGEAFFNAQTWGSWFEFALPNAPVFVDSRWEVIPDEAWDDYEDVVVGREGWQATLDSYGFRVVAVAADQQAQLLPLIGRDPAWTLLYRDADGAVFMRAVSG